MSEILACRLDVALPVVLSLSLLSMLDMSEESVSISLSHSLSEADELSELSSDTNLSSGLGFLGILIDYDIVLGDTNLM